MTTYARPPRNSPLRDQIRWHVRQKRLARARQLAWGRRYATLTSDLRYLRRKAEEEVNKQLSELASSSTD